MATRSTIAVVNPDNSISQIYCHWDGYIKHNGKILVEHYTTLEKVQELISLGDLSSLEMNIHPTDSSHSFETPQDHTCVYYDRDRGEEDVEPKNFYCFHDYLKECQFEEFNYLFKDNKWACTENADDFYDVAEALIVRNNS